MDPTDSPAPEPDTDPHEYTVAGSPVAVLRVKGGKFITIAPLPARTLDSSLAAIELDAADKLILSIQAAVAEEDD
jgi:hypothetical protein